MRFFSFAFVAILISSKAQGNELLNKNLISCTPAPGAGAFLSKCQIANNLILIPAQDIESDFYMTYNLTCDRKYSRPMESKISVVASGSTPLVLNYKDSQNNILIGSGKGPVVLTDALPAELANRNFATGCELTFSELKAKPSAKVKAVWQEQLIAKEALLKSKEDLVRSLTTVVTLLPGYELFSSLLNSIETDLTKNASIIEAAQKLATCENEALDCDVLSKISLDENLKLEAKEILLIGSLRTLLSELPSRTTPLVLKDRMSEQSIQVLEKLSKDTEYYRDANAQIDNTNKEIINLQSDIEVLKKYLAS